ncbi:TetR/AcrR family transcriptional regulator [Maritalea porphyrae]|uniref:HTH tetR-type domain-containing protein n=1 Tax=Maritalea porphyrae TaxID=880732 RepID=A0ABQ5UPX0_9HYPH|nr:TetR family transcriptional regulator [Maritalea porphyrae]GLQ16469.1 hypothetical protein GCM10007879_07180 [Maritalea porphyrae]
MRKPNKRDKIVEVASNIVKQQGVAALTFEAVAKDMGVTKQAIIYYFSSKPKLLEAMFLPHIEAEAAAAIQCLQSLSSGENAAAAFSRAIINFHLSDLDRFRSMYLAPQLEAQKGIKSKLLDEGFAGRVHEVTSGIYDVLSSFLQTEMGLTLEAARRRAFVLHTNALGLVLMQSLADAIDDPLAHDVEELTASLAEMVASKV